jgi:transcriptional regulator with XRE-family HTH domain
MANIYVMRPDAKQTIADAGLTQVELAERTRISRVMINKALHGHYRLRGAYAWRIAQALADHTGVPRDEMFNRLFQKASDTGPSSPPPDG